MADLFPRHLWNLIGWEVIILSRYFLDGRCGAVLSWRIIPDKVAEQDPGQGICPVSATIDVSVTHKN